MNTNHEVHTDEPIHEHFDHWGLCPDCVEAKDYKAEQLWRNVGREHWLCCDRHNCAWPVGSNLFSSWRDEPAELHAANAAKLRTTRIVEGRQIVEGITKYPTSTAEKIMRAVDLDKFRKAMAEIDDPTSNAPTLPN